MSDHETFCEKCASLAYNLMRTPGGQTYHENWAALETSATYGCRLCKFFVTDQAQAKRIGKLYSGASGPIKLKYVWQLHYLAMSVPDDHFTIFELFLLKGVVFTSRQTLLRN